MLICNVILTRLLKGSHSTWATSLLLLCWISVLKWVLYFPVAGGRGRSGAGTPPSSYSQETRSQATRPWWVNVITTFLSQTCLMYPGGTSQGPVRGHHQLVQQPSPGLGDTRRLITDRDYHNLEKFLPWTLDCRLASSLLFWSLKILLQALFWSHV